MTTPQAQPSDVTGAMAALRATAPLPPPQFETVAGGGYHPAQVDSWVKKVEQRLIALGREIESGAADAIRVVARVEGSPKAQALTEDLIRIALDEITGQRAQAAADAAKMISDARTQKAAIIDQAHIEATQVTAGAHEQANALLLDARTTAKQQLDEATAKAAAVSEGAQQRLDALVAIHEQTTTRMREVARVTAEWVEKETQRGSLAAEVQRLTVPPQPEAPVPGPAALDAPLARRPTGPQAAAV